MLEGFDDNFVYCDKTYDAEKQKFENLPDSRVYLQKLENKLSKLTKGNKELKPKDMLSVLKIVKEDQMNHLTSSNNETSFLPEVVDLSDKELSHSYIERKLFPQKNALTFEELQHLLEADILAKLSAENSSDKCVER